MWGQEGVHVGASNLRHALYGLHVLPGLNILSQSPVRLQVC